MLWKFETNSWEHHEGSGTFDLSVQDEIRRDPFGIHDQGNQARNGFVHQTIVLVKKAVLAEKSAMKELSLTPLGWYMVCLV